MHPTTFFRNLEAFSYSSWLKAQTRRVARIAMNNIQRRNGIGTNPSVINTWISLITSLALVLNVESEMENCCASLINLKPIESWDTKTMKVKGI